MMNIHLDKIMSNDISMDIVDLTGRIVSSQIIKKNEADHTVNVQSLTSGIYMVKFYNDDFSTTGKFVKE